MFATPTHEAASKLLSLSDEKLFEQATLIREAVFGNHVDLCVIINAKSGNCQMDCRFCAQSRHNQGASPVSDFLNAEKIVEIIERLSKKPVNHIGVVASGARIEPREIDEFIASIASMDEDIVAKICVSFGHLKEGQLERLKIAGIRRYHHNLETSESYYPQICTTQSWHARKNTVKLARIAGLKNCTGGIFGLGESWQDRIDLAFALKELGISQVPLNFLHPQPGTPLAAQTPLSATEALRIIALFRHILPQATLRVCGGRPTVLGKRGAEIFQAGANALMTGDYLTTSGISLERDLEMLADQNLHLLTV